MSAASVPQQAIQMIGRFELRRVLGQGAQATVWLAFDPQLEREVALKLFQQDVNPAEVDAWLREARLMATLTHPGILTVYEAGRDGSRPYLVLELVDGLSLSQRVKASGALPVREAVQIMRDVLDAVAFAHARGVIHRDLKPSNVLLSSDGRAKVMDFGIAARLSGQHDGRIVGTPGYISPEAAQGQPPTAQMDVYSAGMLLGHLLCGMSLRSDPDPMRALRRAIDEDVAWPSNAVADAVDTRLRAAVLRAVERDPSQRFESAADLRDILSDWLRPPPLDADTLSGTIEFLLRRMRVTGDFPALSDQVSRIQGMALADNKNVSDVTEEIQKDVGLTSKLLKLVNSAQFRGGRGEPVTSVSHATKLVGFNAIRNMALSAVLLEHMNDAGHADQMRELFMKAILTASINDGLASTDREREEAFLLGMLSQLGRMLVGYYFPQEAKQIADRLPAGSDSKVEDEDAVVRDVLGLSYDELGQGIARQWGFSDALLKQMVRPTGDAPAREARSPAERNAWRLRLAEDMAKLVIKQDAAKTPEAGRQASDMADDMARRYSAVLGAAPALIKNAVASAQTHFKELASSFRSKFGGKRKDASAATLPGHAGSHAAVRHTSTTTLQGGPNRSALSAGIAEVTNLLASDGFKLNDVLTRILQIMAGGASFDRVLFCLREPSSGDLTARIGVGKDVEAWRARMRVSLRQNPPKDVFSASCIKGVDTLIADAKSPALHGRLPEWFAGDVPAGFLLLPLQLKGAPFALIYADRSGSDVLQIDSRDLAHLRTLRNQAVMAFKASHG